MINFNDADMNTHALFEIKLNLLHRNLVPPFLINTRFICCWNEQSIFYIGSCSPQLLGKLPFSAASGHVFAPFERYRHPKNTSNKFFQQFYKHDLCKKRNSLQILKIKIFSRDKKIYPEIHQILIIFGTTAPTMEGFWVSLKPFTL